MAKNKTQLLIESLEGTVAGTSLAKAIAKGRTDDVLKKAIATYAKGGTKQSGRRNSPFHAPDAEFPISDFIVAGPQSKAVDGLDPWAAVDRKDYGKDANPVRNPREKKAEEAKAEEATVAKIEDAPKAKRSRRRSKPATTEPVVAEQGTEPVAEQGTEQGTDEAEQSA